MGIAPLTPPPPQEPKKPTAPSLSAPPSAPKTTTDISQSALESAFSQLLGPSATPQDIAKAINNLINYFLNEMKRDAQKMDEAIKKLGKTAKDEDDS